jgi:RNA polymerase sigma-70 factor (ECF subfamily)
VQKQRENISVDDAVLVRHARHGDTSAMARLILKYQDRIFNAVLKICGNNADAAELTQETFVKVIEKLDTFEGRSTFYTWVFRVAVNLSLNYCKRKSKLNVRSLDASVSPGDGEARGQLSSFLTDERAPDPAEIAEKKEIQGLVLDAVKMLDDDQRTIVVLRDIEGMNYAEISETLDLELGTVKSRLSRARVALKDILKGMLG